MTKNIIITTLLALMLSPLFAEKHAILIGISQYPLESKWGNISASNDLELLKNTLSSEWNIIKLENEQATYNSIIALFDSINKTVNFGDTLLIHFSCHGQQMIPLASEYDNLDEALIPYDAEKDWSPNYKGEKHLRDDELSKHIDKLRIALGTKGFVLVLLDACHSDSMDRNNNEIINNGTIYRGTSDIFGEKIHDTIIEKRYERDDGTISINNNSHVVYLSACQAYSKNAEIVYNNKGYGSLSFAFSNSLENGTFSDIENVLNKIVLSMDTLVPYQTPGIRTSFTYKKPELNGMSTQHCSNNAYNKNYIPIITLIILVFTLLVVWITKK